MPRRAFHDVVVVVGDGDKLAADRAAGELDGMDIEVEWNLVAHRGRPQNAEKVPGIPVLRGKELVIGTGSVVSQIPLTVQEPSALSTKARSSGS